ncbi:predicted protein [Streptomyces viridochromogenes DSM 40736]|uniref:Predicted protein n=1 Tax=Streptomyces viridochromogenes (strain DSM 40736 / JCM 4977 / BCRC 1201 / Tue 494) TaxID=591159 RepID=D9X1X9_STRVT|nr:predicted protein [Streptomyces viridochromogenes DSM 40736]
MCVQRVLISAARCYGAQKPDGVSAPFVGRPRMRTLVAAATGLAVALAVVLTLTALGAPSGGTSPKPLLTTVPAHP